MDQPGAVKVLLGKLFAQAYVNFPESDRRKIMLFIQHLSTYGFHGLVGRNKSSDNVHPDDPNWLES